MDAERYQQVKAVLDAALELEPDKRSGFLDEKCADDNELRVAVEALLAAHDKAQSFLEHAGPANATTVTVKGPDGTPERIGAYKILEQIGEGGMGVVYLAEQVEPIRRRVALKLIKLGMDSKQVVARFEAERQALALMDHPNVAKVFDAGATDEGRPYFVMEYVKGIPITKYCDQNRLSNRDRLALFIQVCEAIQHAHQKGIIHRDIKPSNVLVALHDEKPVPKVIDFGVAKATSQRLTERTLFTQHGILVGTPEYMSPEQAGTTGLDVDTRTDVYSLGVLLYELLVGALPFEPRRLREAAALEMQRIIREEEPPKPSTKFESLGDSATDAAKLRCTDARSLAKQLRGELDWITMRAMEKDRARRYGSASDLAGDIWRHLRHKPVLAGPPGMAYRAQKFVRRHRIGVGASVLGAFLLVSIVLTSLLIGRYRSTLVLETMRREEASVFTAIAANCMQGESTADSQSAAVVARLEDRILRRQALPDDHRTFGNGLMRVSFSGRALRTAADLPFHVLIENCMAEGLTGRIGLLAEPRLIIDGASVTATTPQRGAFRFFDGAAVGHKFYFEGAESLGRHRIVGTIEGCLVIDLDKVTPDDVWGSEWVERMGEVLECDGPRFAIDVSKSEFVFVEKLPGDFPVVVDDPQLNRLITDQVSIEPVLVIRNENGFRGRLAVEFGRMDVYTIAAFYVAIEKTEASRIRAGGVRIGPTSIGPSRGCRARSRPRSAECEFAIPPSFAETLQEMESPEVVVTVELDQEALGTAREIEYCFDISMRRIVAVSQEQVE